MLVDKDKVGLDRMLYMQNQGSDSFFLEWYHENLIQLQHALELDNFGRAISIIASMNQRVDRLDESNRALIKLHDSLNALSGGFFDYSAQPISNTWYSENRKEVDSVLRKISLSYRDGDQESYIEHVDAFFGMFWSLKEE